MQSRIISMQESISFLWQDLCPEYIAEKAIPIGIWTVLLGIFTHIGDQPNIAASERVVKFLTDDIEDMFGGKFYVEADPYIAAEKIIEVIEEKRKALGI